ncbi:MAG TPA: hypothetical protein VF865_03450 [Acidobacteriaceae bacterium]
MPFDPQQFAAEVSLGLIPSESFPSVAQDALVAGFDGKWIRRMAILETPSGWEIDQVLPKMLADLSTQFPGKEEAALLLAKIRVHRIQQTTEDPLKSIGYFNQLYLNADYPTGLQELGWIEDHYSWTDDAGVRAAAVEAMENLLDPELAAHRHAARTAAWEEQRRGARQEWPFVLNSPSGRDKFRQHWKERLLEMCPLIWILFAASALLVWSLGSWKIALVILLAMIPWTLASSSFGVYRQMKRECQNARWRSGLDK